MGDRRTGFNDAGGFVKWDWNKKKYIWVSKDEISQKGQQQPHKPGRSNYAWQRAGNKPAVARKPLYQVPVKKAYRQPLQVANKHGKIKTPSPKKPAVKHHYRQKDFRLPSYDHVSVSDQENLAPNHKGSAARDKHGPPPPELLAGHSTILSVMSNRLIHTNAALTFWRQGPNEFISYLLRTRDDATSVDTLPTLVHCMKNKTKASKQLSMGACFELMPTLKRLLGSKFEDYVKTSLDVLRTMLRFWWADLMAHRESAFSGTLHESRSMAGIYTSAVALTDVIAKLCRRKDSIAKKAEIVGSLLAQL